MERTAKTHIHLLGWIIAVIMAVKVGFPRLFGLLDNDSIVIFTDAETWMLDGFWSMLSTLHVFLVSVFYRLMGVSLSSARWVSVLASLGVMLLLYFRGLREGNRRTGLLAAMLFAVAPIGVFYGVSALPYGSLTFFAFLGIYLLAEALEDGKSWLGLPAGLSLGAAFLCKTFAAAFIFPVVVYFFTGLLFADSRRKKMWLAPLLAGLAWTVVIGATVAWRYPVFGASVFNDYPIDWRFDMAKAVWSGRWAGLVTLNALMLPLLAPGLFLALRRGRQRIFDGLAVWMILTVAAVYLLNPVNHFPRVLLPLMPFLTWFAGREMCFAFDDENRPGIAPAWALVTLGFAFTSLFVSHEWMSDGRPWIMSISVFLVLAAFLPLMHLLIFRAEKFRAWAATLLVGGIVLFGLVEGYRALDRVDRAYGARIEAVRVGDETSGVLGGGDVVTYVAHGTNNFATLTDLLRDRLYEVLKFGLAPVARDLKTRVIIVDRFDQEGALAMLAALAQEMTVSYHDPYVDLDADPQIVRVMDNGIFSVYRIEDVPPYERQDWPDWKKAVAVWDRTGMTASHPTPARLKVYQRPPDQGSFVAGTDRRVIVDLTDLPGGEEIYDLVVKLKNEAGEEIWRQVSQANMTDGKLGMGVRLYQLTVGRSPGEDETTVRVPLSIEGARTVEVEAVPTGGAQSMRVFVRLPDWW